jgi:hypothetical protein
MGDHDTKVCREMFKAKFIEELWSKFRLFHKVPNVEVTGAARLYRAASSD